MVKVFTLNKNGKIEFTKSKLKKLLKEVWLDGKANGSYVGSSPYLQTITSTPSPYTTYECATGVTVDCIKDNNKEL